MQYFKFVNSEDTIMVVMSGLYEYDSVEQVKSQVQYVVKTTAMRMMCDFNNCKFHSDMCLTFYVNGVICNPVIEGNEVVDIIRSDTTCPCPDDLIFKQYVVCGDPNEFENYKLCYQCDARVMWLAADGRCKDCTRLTPDEVQGIVVVEDEDHGVCSDCKSSLDWYSGDEHMTVYHCSNDDCQTAFVGPPTG